MIQHTQMHADWHTTVYLKPTPAMHVVVHFTTQEQVSSPFYLLSRPFTGENAYLMCVYVYVCVLASYWAFDSKINY